MADESPAHFTRLEGEGGRWHWRNALLGTDSRFVPGDAESLPLASLDQVGRQVQEDLLVLDGAREGFPLVAGQRCFPSGWCLDQKLGRPLLEVHAPVPRFTEQVGAATLRLMEGLKPGRTVPDEMSGYKRLGPLREPLLAYLEAYPTREGPSGSP